jgi:hypothetical protein
MNAGNENINILMFWIFELKVNFHEKNVLWCTNLMLKGSNNIYVELSYVMT